MAPDGNLDFNKWATMDDIVVYEFGIKEDTRWGMWEVVTNPKKTESGIITECQKHITVNPDASLSLQIHKGRGETYKGLEGVTHVCVNGRIIELKAGEELYIPRGALHFSWNESGEKSKFHEIQAGPLCNEADIRRSADKYKLAHELDPDDDVVQMMIDVCADRFEKNETPYDDYDLLNIYIAHQNNRESLTQAMNKVLQNCIELHRDRTPTPMPQLNVPVAQCKKKV